MKRLSLFLFLVFAIAITSALLIEAIKRSREQPVEAEESRPAPRFDAQFITMNGSKYGAQDFCAGFVVTDAKTGAIYLFSRHGGILEIK